MLHSENPTDLMHLRLPLLKRKVANIERTSISKKHHEVDLFKV